ncbi:MAG: metallophosphoesterase [Pirellulaceae bacterium]
MKLGLIADIHEHVEFLDAAIRVLKGQDVDQIVMLGDVFETGDRLRETCRLLADAGARGVWGNHDYGLSVDPTPDTRARYGDEAMAYMTSLRPFLEIGPCFIQHIEAWLNPAELMDLWYFDGVPSTAEQFARSFAAVTSRVVLVGHFHRWLLGTPTGPEPWHGERTVRLAPPERYFLGVGAVCDGACGVLDLDTSELQPIQLDSSAIRPAP